MSLLDRETQPTPTGLSSTLVDALLQRRSQRFGKGFVLDGGPLSFASGAEAQPLSIDDEAALVFAASGVTGAAFADLPFAPGSADPLSSGGNIMINLVARTAPSGDAVHANTLFVLNDEGAWFVRRPQDYVRADVPELVELAGERRFTDLYQRARVQIATERPTIAQVFPHTPAFNRWSANKPGSTYLLPIADLTGLYINVMLSAFSDPFNVFMLDDRNSFRPAGVARFAASKGGPLDDDSRHEKVGTISILESWLLEFSAFEQGAMLQNAGLMAAALGIAGFPHFAAHFYSWPLALGYRMQALPFSRVTGMNPLLKTAARAMKRDLPLPTALGLEHNGETLIKPYCPPYYPTMRAAVLAFIEQKFRHGSGVFRDGGQVSRWKEPEKVQAGIPVYSDATIDATIAYLEYVYDRYGRIPVATGPARSVLAYQAQHADAEFYETFYR